MQALVETLLVNVMASAVVAVLALAVERRFRDPRLARAFWIAALLLLVLPLWRWLPSGRDVLNSRGAAPKEPWIVVVDALLVSIVAVGAGVYSAGLIVRWLRWRRLLAFAWPAPGEVQTAAAGLAARLGLARCPPVFFTPFRISPALVALWGRPSIVLPARLLERLSTEQAEALLAHELVHYVHRDHWLRPLDWLATGLFWWCPLTWVLLRRLRLAVERACDAVAADLTKQGPRVYAAAILETVEFLGAGSTSSRHRPDRALRTRLVQVLEGPLPRRAPWGGLAAGVVCLLLMPAQRELLERFPRGMVRRGDAGAAAMANVSADAALKALEEPPAPWPTPSPSSATAKPEPGPWATIPSPDGSCTLQVSTGNRIQWRDSRTSRARDLESAALCAAFSPDGTRFYLGGRDGCLQEYSASAGERTRAILPSGPAIRSVAAGDNLVAVSDGAGQVRLFDLPSSGAARQLTTECQAAGCVRVTRDGRYLAVADGHWEAEVGRIELWDLNRDELLVVLASPTSIGALALVESDGPPTILTLDWSGQALLWSEGTAELVGWLPKEYVSAAAFAPIDPFRLQERAQFGRTARQRSSRLPPTHGVMAPR